MSPTPSHSRQSSARRAQRYARPSVAKWSSVSSTIRCRAPPSTARSTIRRKEPARGRSRQSVHLSQTGKVRIRGAELEVIYRVTPDLDLIGAYAYIDARRGKRRQCRQAGGDRAALSGLAVGQAEVAMIAGTPGFSAGAGVRYVGEWRLWNEAIRFHGQDAVAYAVRRDAELREREVAVPQTARRLATRSRSLRA